MQTRCITFNVTAFRAQFKAFENDVAYPTPILQGWWDLATNYISNLNYGWLNGSRRAQALNLMTAHLLAINEMISNGQAPVFVKGATIDKISVTLEPPPVKSQFAWWLNNTPYGQQLYALLYISGVGGMYIGGSAQRAAFEGGRNGGRFGF